MRSEQNAIKFGIDQYYDVYTKAIFKYWKHDEIINGIPVEAWFIAQATQESRFDEKAVSPVGALGLAQFMPQTAQMIAKELSHENMFKDGFDAGDAVKSIYAQVYYMNKLFNTWSWKRSATSKMQLAFASYNAGIGNILKAQKVSGNKKHWIEIKGSLRRVTGKHSKETVIYVSNICNYMLIVEDLKHNS